MNQNEIINQKELMNKTDPMNQNEISKSIIKIKETTSLYDMHNTSHLYFHPKSEKCVFNEYGQCIKGFRYFCAYCNYGLGGIYSSCHNSKCDIPKCDNSF